MSKSILYLVRHGKTRDNIPGITRPYNSDVPLNEVGIKEITEVANKFKEDGISPLIYTSPTERCKQSAEIISKITGGPFRVDRGLDSWNYGDIALEEDLKPFQENWTRTPPGGEPYGKFAWTFKKALTTYWLSEEPVLLVTHSRNLYLLQYWVEGLPEIPVSGMDTGLLFELKTKLKD